MIMEQNSKYIEELLERFFEGSTSNAEEQELYKYFWNENTVAPELKKYRPMVQYFDEGIEKDLETTFDKKGDAIVGVDKKSINITLLKKWMIGISAIAASLLLLFLASPFIGSNDFNPYEGSYVKKDGLTIYDKAEIEAEQARIEQLVAQKLACLGNPFSEAEEKLAEYEKLENRIEKVIK